MNKKIIPTAILNDLSENIGIDKMTVRYTQGPDGNDPDQQLQFLTVEAVNYDDADEESVSKGDQGYYLALSTERWAIDNPKEMELVLNDFFARLGYNPGLPLLKTANLPDNIVIPHHEPVIVGSEDGSLERYPNRESQDPLEGVDFNEEPIEEPGQKPNNTLRQSRQVDVLVDGEWESFASINKAAQALGVSPAWLGKSLQLGKTCNGRPVRYSNPELDACISEIELRLGKVRTTPK